MEVAEVIAVGAAKVIGLEVAEVIARIGRTTRGSETRRRPKLIARDGGTMLGRASSVAHG